MPIEQDTTFNIHWEKTENSWNSTTYTLNGRPKNPQNNTELKTRVLFTCELMEI